MDWYLTAKIKKMPNGKYRVTDESGKKNLGESNSRSGAEKRLKQVEYFKHKKACSQELSDFRNSFRNNKFDLFKFCSNMIEHPKDHIDIKILKRRGKKVIASFLETDKDIIDIQPEDKTILKEAANFFEQVMETKYQDSINIDKYDLFIFDFDKTLSTDDSNSAAEMKEPFHLEDAQTIKDSEDHVVKLKDGVLETLVKLVNKGKKLFLISKAEAPELPIEEQPLIGILKTFNIFDLFNEGFVICRELPKSIFVPQKIDSERIVFIDDDIRNLKDMEKNQNIDVADATEIDFE